MEESNADRMLSQSTLQQTAQRRRTGVHDAVIAQREQEIEQIAKGIIELSGIFQELNTMVIDQGTMLDRIDYNVERMAVDVKAADKELTVATNYQKKSVKRKIMLFLLLLVVGMVILLSLKLGTRRRRTDSDQPAIQPAPPPQLATRFARDLMRTAGKHWRRRKRKIWTNADGGLNKVL